MKSIKAGGYLRLDAIEELSSLARDRKAVRASQESGGQLPEQAERSSTIPSSWISATR